MCASSGELELVARAFDTADAVLARGFGVPLAKAAPTTPRGFERTVARLAGILRERAAPVERAAAHAITGALAVDWRELAPRARERAVVHAAEVAREAGRALPARIRASLEKAAVGVVESVRREARLRQGLALGVDFNAVDRRVIDHVARTQTNFVRDAFGRRCDEASARARAVVAAGLERGLGSGEIGRELGEAMRTVIEGRSPFYWEVVASSFIGDGRTYAQMSAFAEAGIETYRWLSVMDQHTCLPANAIVEVQHGDRAIVDVSCGDLVRTHRGRWRTVIATRVINATKPTLRVTTTTAAVTTTADHRFLVRRGDVFGWVRGDQLQQGDLLLRRASGHIRR